MTTNPLHHRITRTALCLGITIGGSVLLSVPASHATQDVPCSAAVTRYNDIGEIVALRKEAAAQYAVDHERELAAER